MLRLFNFKNYIIEAKIRGIIMDLLKNPSLFDRNQCIPTYSKLKFADSKS